MFRRQLAALALLLPLPAFAQQGGTAHLYAYAVTDRPAFEAGYRRHLQWHAARGDKLAWFGWYVTEGDRKGAFVDGTFGTTPEALAARPDPEGDGADFRANAAPFSKPLGNEGWELWREASTATPLEDRRPSATVRVFALAAADAAQFEAAVRAAPRAGASWYRATGQGAATHLLIAPADTPPPAYPGARTVRAETWTYAPRLALMPGEPLAP